MKKLFTLPIINILIFIFAFCIFLNSSAYAQTPAWIWAKSASGANGDGATAIAIDAAENTIVTGWFESSTLTFGSNILTNLGNEDIFIAKYDANGNVLWAKSAGGNGNDWVKSIVVDVSGNIYVTGYYQSPTIAFGSITLTNIGTSDLFLAKYDANGNILWAKSAGGTAIDYAYSISVDVSGNTYITGWFQSPTITFGSTTLTNIGTSDLFLAKYDTNGNVLWAKSANGTTDGATSIFVDTYGYIYVAGWFGSSTFTLGSSTLTNEGSGDIFLAKYDTYGNVLWAKSAGGTGGDMVSSVTVDISGNIYLTGNFYSPTLTFGSTTLTNAGYSNLFLAKYNANGNLLWAKSAGGSGGDGAYSVAIDASWNIYIAGVFSSPSITFGSTILTNTDTSSSAEEDIFLAKYDVNGNAVWAKSTGGMDGDGASSVAVDALGNIYIAGGFYSSIISFGSTTLTNGGSACDIFIAKSANGTGLNEFINSLNISVFPNPASDIIKIIILEKSTLEISNINGQIIKTINHNSGETSIDLVDLSSGVYIVRVKTDKEIVTKKFIKQ